MTTVAKGHHRLEHRVREHMVLCMLAYYVGWRLLVTALSRR